MPVKRRYQFNIEEEEPSTNLEPGPAQLVHFATFFPPPGLTFSIPADYKKDAYVWPTGAVTIRFESKPKPPSPDDEKLPYNSNWRPLAPKIFGKPNT